MNCRHCNVVVEAAIHEHNGYCIDCQVYNLTPDDNSFECSVCGGFVGEDDIHKSDGKVSGVVVDFCPNCWDALAVKCDECGLHEAPQELKIRHRKKLCDVCCSEWDRRQIAAEEFLMRMEANGAAPFAAPITMPLMIGDIVKVGLPLKNPTEYLWFKIIHLDWEGTGLLAGECLNTPVMVDFSRGMTLVFGEPSVFSVDYQSPHRTTKE